MTQHEGLLFGYIVTQHEGLFPRQQPLEDALPGTVSHHGVLTLSNFLSVQTKKTFSVQKITRVSQKRQKNSCQSKTRPKESCQSKTKYKSKLPVSPKNKKHPVSYNNKKEEKKTSCQSLFVTDRKLSSSSSFFFFF